ncbi:MAG: histidine phosphatase family protein [Candidatus Sericytochromatia bacterium]
MELLVIRHGQSMGEVEERHEGQADFPLSALGYEQAQQIATYLYRHYPPDQVISSPLERARETARLIAQPLQIPVIANPALSERDNGMVSGMLRSEALERYPYPPQGRAYYERFFEGESELEQRLRVEGFFARLCDHPPAYRVALVSHRSTINLLFRAFAQLPNQSNFYLSTSEAAIHLWHINDRYRQILFSNFRGHLEHPSV